MNFTDEINCGTCIHGYFMDFSFDGFHNLCGAGNCYLCAENNGRCYDYEKGDVPKDKERLQ